jgi:hypothetical protein
MSVHPECVDAHRELLFVSAVSWGSLLGTGPRYLTIFLCGIVCLWRGLLSFYVRCLGTSDCLEDCIGLDCVGTLRLLFLVNSDYMWYLCRVLRWALFLWQFSTSRMLFMGPKECDCSLRWLAKLELLDNNHTPLAP